jgi:CheY-like chemotaxis protein
MGTPVLVVDDDEGVRESLRWILEDEGYTVYEAPNGSPALERLRDHPSGMVVLLDLNMPGVDGMDVMRAVEEQEQLAARHAYIVMTASGRTLPLAFAKQLTRLRTPVLTKPFDLENLLDTVATAARKVC